VLVGEGDSSAPLQKKVLILRGKPNLKKQTAGKTSE